MKTKKLEGIVISETNYSESSKILNIYTKELGIVSVISKGCRRLKSPLRSVSSRLIYGNFIVSYKEGGLSTLINVDILCNFSTIFKDIEKISFATYILELASQVAKQNNSLEIFETLIESLKKINEGIDAQIITLIVELQYLKYLGIDVDFDECSICGNKDDIVTFNVDKHGYVCKNCYSNEKIVSQKSVKVIRLLYHVDISRLTKLDLSSTTINEISSFLEEYYDKYSGLFLKSKKFIKLINNK